MEPCFVRETFGSRFFVFILAVYVSSRLSLPSFPFLRIIARVLSRLSLLAHHCASSFTLSFLPLSPFRAGVLPSPSCRLLDSRCRRMPTWRRSRRSLLLSFRCAIFALASADKSSPRPLRAQLCLLIRDLIPSRFIFPKNTSKICICQKNVVSLQPQRTIWSPLFQKMCPFLAHSQNFYYLCAKFSA